jgi:hypothetical protein
MSDSSEQAGQSALLQAAMYDDFGSSIERQIRSLQEALAEHRQRSGSYRAGADGERAVAASVERVLVDLGSADWHILADRRWPGTRRANLDLVLVGPPGVLVLDSKKWRAPRIERGSLWNGDVLEDDTLDKLGRQADSVAGVLAEIGLAPAAVLPYLVLAGRKFAGVEVRGVVVVGERSVQAELVRLGSRLDSADVATLVEALDHACPPASDVTPTRAFRLPVPRPPSPQAHPVPSQTTRAGEELVLLEDRDLWASVLESATREPMETWMTWLHPAQTQLTVRSYSGPARVRGAAGTGKTVVALHRARHLARRPGARILMTSFVRTLPVVHRSLFERLAPAHADKVEFLGIHQWAVRLLTKRGHNVVLRNHTDARAVFSALWRGLGPGADLVRSALGESYWWDEIETVIKGRGLRSSAEYLALNRVGRRTPLREEQRLAVWQLYEEYQRRLTAEGVWDWADVMLQALDSLQNQPLPEPYTSVIVDEVQDLMCVGLRLMHAVVGDAPDGLFLVGDGQQSIYPGGFTLVESGVSVTGRATVLNRNYRNGAQILRTALEIVSSDQFDDLDSDPEPGIREVEFDREGGQVKVCGAVTPTSQRTALLNDLQWTINADTRPGDIAILVRTNRDAETWSRYLEAAGVPALLLTDYDGRPSAAVKVGTYQRAKGLEFSCVFLPDHDRAVPAQKVTETDEAFRERAELQRRQLFVAMTRARDRLWLGGQTPPSARASSASV